MNHTKYQQIISGGAGSSHHDGKQGKGGGAIAATAAASIEQQLDQPGTMSAKTNIVMMEVVKMQFISIIVVVTKVILMT